MRGKHLAVIEALVQSPEWVTARQLASQLQVSSRSVINYIGEINYQEEGLIEASKSGYRINRERAKKVLERQSGTLPETSAERVNYMITELLSSDSMQDQGIDLYEISERIFVSYETLRKDLVKVRKKVKEYGLFANVSNSSVRLEGKEIDKRKLLSAILYEEFNRNIVSLELVQKAFPDYDLEILRDIVLTECRRYHYYINDYAMLNLILEIAITMERIQKNCTFRTHIAENRNFKEQEAELVRSIAGRVEDTFFVSITGMELQELTSLILSHLMRMDDNEWNTKSINTFVPAESMAIVRCVLDYLNENYYIDTSDQEFIVKFSIHINNLLLRMENHYTAKNPLTDHIKKTCPLIFECAVGVANCLNQMTGYRIDEDEIAYIAIHIGGTLENNGKMKDKLSCVLLFPQYYDMSDIMAERINKEFSSSLVVQDVITRISELSTLKKADILISTIDVQDQKWEYVVTVNPFLRADDLEKIHEKISRIKKEKKKKHLRETLLRITSPELFHINRENWNQDQALEAMVREMEGQGYVNPDFIREVKEREKHSTTAFGRLAVPHALELNAYKTGIYILNSEKPIEWGGDLVSLVLLFAINRDDRILFHEVFDNLVVLLLEKQNLDRVLASRNYGEFVNTILSCE